jgi:hypothetical protein
VIENGQSLLWNPECLKVAMPIARITSQGLIAIALLVAALWACILAEHSITRTALRTGASSLHELRVLRNSIRKVSTPAPSPAPDHRA